MNTINTDVPMVTRSGFLDMQVCVPKEWNDEQVKSFADNVIWCGTDTGWQIRKQGDKLLNGADERGQCSERSGCVHITLDA